MTPESKAPLGAGADEFFGRLSFEPDPFQIDAVRILEAGDSVVVTAPTGAGKTLVAEAAVADSYAAGDRAFYTTPIKALSNQKFADLRADYGTDNVGLLTGDNVINGEAPIVVMTTEVLRNMIYADSRALNRLGVVILDEVHYLQDPSRGQVWEEVIIHLPAGIPVVALSATIANPEELTDWIRTRRGPTGLVVESQRPVPLESLYMLVDRNREHRVELFPVFGEDGARPNPDITRLLKRDRGRRRRFATPRRLEVVETLRDVGVLPVIYFIFSRAGCDQAADVVANAGLSLTDSEARREIRALAEQRTAHLPDQDLGVLGYDRWLSNLEAGVAAHHAGLVPAFKETVEDLFVAGLIQVVFATETLALGINMPARTVAIERLSKFTGEAHEALLPGDYTQLTGRAGRRGIDTAGTAIVLHDPYTPFDQVTTIAAAGTHPLVSAFRPTYNMAVNMIANYQEARATELLRASFAQFRAERRRRLMEDRIAQRERDLEEFRASAFCERGDIWKWIDAQGMPPARDTALRDFAQGLLEGDVLTLEHDPSDRWVLLARSYGASPRLQLLSMGGETKRIASERLPLTVARVGTMPLPQPVRGSDGGYQRTVASMLTRWEESSEDVPPMTPLPPDDSAVAACPDLSDHLRWVRRYRRLEKELGRLRKRTERGFEDVVVGFGRIRSLLGERGYVSGWRLTPKGQQLRFIYNELDLLLTEAIRAGACAGLRPAELAALTSMFTYEARIRDVPRDWPSPTVAERGEAIESLATELNTLERTHRVPESRPTDGGFAAVIHAWAEGAGLDDLFAEDDGDAGDFVRNARQVLDLLRQIRDAVPELSGVAGHAIELVDRGVVAAGGRV